MEVRVLKGKTILGRKIAANKSFGQIVNSFYELEPVYADFKFDPKAWSVGPLCLPEPSTEKTGEDGIRRPWIEWLDRKLDEGKPVLYVAEISLEKFWEIKTGLEKLEVNFLWAVRKKRNRAFRRIKKQSWKQRPGGQRMDWPEGNPRPRKRSGVLESLWLEFGLFSCRICLACCRGYLREGFDFGLAHDGGAASERQVSELRQY